MVTRPSIVAVHPPVLFCRNGSAWGVLEVEPVPYAYASEADRSELLLRTAGALWSAGTELHVLGLTRPVDRREATDRLMANQVGDAWARQAPQWADVVCDRGAFQRRFLLAVRLPQPSTSPWNAIRRAFLDVSSTVETAVGIAARLTPREIQARMAQTRQVQAVLGSRISAHPVDRELLSWTIRHPYLRGLSEDGGFVSHGPSNISIDGPGLAASREAGIEEHLRFLRVDVEATASVQGFVALAQLPSRLPFPGTEWLFLAEEAAFPVDWSVRVVALPAGHARARAERKALELADQDYQLSGGDFPAPLALAEARADAEELRYRLQTTGAPLLFCSVLFCVWATDEPELNHRIEELRALYEPRLIQLARPTGDQYRAFHEACLGETTMLRDYLQVLPPETVAGAIPFGSRAVGDPSGQLLGFISGGLRRPVFLDPHRPPLRDRSPSMALVGTLGAGKSFAAKVLLHGALLRGARGLVIDPKEEYRGLAGLMGEDARVIRLAGENGDASLDPFASLPSIDAARAAALSFLTLLLGIPPVSATGAVLARAVARVAATPSPSLALLPELLAEEGPQGRELAGRLEVFRALPLSALPFGRTGQPILTARLTVIQTPDLDLPDEATIERDLREGRLTPERQLSLALLYLVAALGEALVAGDRRMLKLLVVDEAWTVVGTPEGQALIERLVRMGRSRNAGVWLITQDASDLPAIVRDNLGMSLAFRAGGTDSARVALALVGGEETDENLQLIRSLPTGRCLFRDLDGRIELVDVASALPDQAPAFQTGPADGA